MKENIELLDDEQVLKKELEELERKEKEIEEKLREKERLREKKERLSEALQSIESKKTPADKGREAFLSGKGLKENPYSVSVREDQANYEEWLEAWIESCLKQVENVNPKSEPSESIVRRLDLIEESLKASQSPENKESKPSDKVIDNAIIKITQNAEGQIRRARRYMVKIGVVFILIIFGMTLLNNVVKDSTVKSQQVERVEQVKITE